ncbi:MAG: hypothetical protein Q4A78_04225 [Peptostreptococcaceae bacterium]|nr:hypothetical protein [Peptostreptococcaceae bacterium]
MSEEAFLSITGTFPLFAEEALYGFSGYQVGRVVLMEKPAAVIKEDEYAL